MIFPCLSVSSSLKMSENGVLVDLKRAAKFGVTSNQKSLWCTTYLPPYFLLIVWLKSASCEKQIQPTSSTQLFPIQTKRCPLHPAQWNDIISVFRRNHFFVIPPPQNLLVILCLFNFCLLELTSGHQYKFLNNSFSPHPTPFPLVNPRPDCLIFRYFKI